jgi:hypothetical protein
MDSQDWFKSSSLPIYHQEAGNPDFSTSRCRYELKSFK